MKYFSMFSGVGGFEKGIEQAYGISNKQSTEIKQDGQGRNRDSDEVGHDVLSTSRTAPLCIGYSEIDKYAIKVYERNFNGHKNYGDATAINTAELPDFDLLVGGFPCQAFSIAGKRAGFEDTRGTLIFDIVRILRDKRPRHFVLENVKGLLSHDSGKTFSHILEILTDAGYDISWSVHNSKNYGVPQNRERIFIIGNLRGERRPQVFPITQDDRTIDEGLEKGVQQANTLRARDYASWRGNHIEQLNQPTHSNDRVYGTDGISPTLNTMQGGLRQPFIAAQRGRANGQMLEAQMEDKTNTVTSVAKDNYLVIGKNGEKKNNQDFAATLTGGGHSGGNHSDMDLLAKGSRIRRLTPKECERLQGFPDDWTKYGINDEPISDTQRYKMAGNAVTTNVVEAVIRGLLPCL